ncbi:ankyrin, partial [Clathrospora elynae]
AVFHGQLNVVEIWLLRADVDLNSKDHSGNIPLQLAAQRGHAEMLRTLLRHDAVDLPAKQNNSSCGETPLHIATKRCKIEIVKLLLRHDDMDIN